MNLDVRWKQRFHNFEKAFLFFEQACKQKSYSQLEAAGLVQCFEFTFELAWKTLKDFLTEQAFIVQSPRETIKQAFASDYLKDGHTWIQMLEQRNLLSHTYNEKQAQAATNLIRESYYPAIQQAYQFLKSIS